MLGVMPDILMALFLRHSGLGLVFLLLLIKWRMLKIFKSCGLEGKQTRVSLKIEALVMSMVVKIQPKPRRLGSPWRVISGMLNLDRISGD